MSEKRIFTELTIEELTSIINKEVAKTLTQLKSLYIPDDILTKREVAEYFQVSTKTIEAWTDSGWLISYRIGNQIRFKKSEIQNAMNKIN